MKIKTAAIVGAGGLGVMYGKHLRDHMEKNNVRIIVNEERKKRYEEQCIFCNEERCDFEYVEAGEQRTPVDLLIIAVKMNQLEQAIKDAANQVGENTIIISVLNGIISEDYLIRAFGQEKVLYCVVQGMDVVKKGNRITYQKMGFIRFGEKDKTMSDKVKALAAFFDEMEMAYEIPDNIMHQLWSKLMLNTGVNQAAVVFDTNYSGIHVDGEPRRMMIAAMQEAAKLAEAEGIVLTEEEITEWVRIIDGLSPDGMPSMRQDILAGRKTEVDLFAKTMIDLGKKHGIPTPVNDYFYEVIKEKEERLPTNS